MEVALEKTDYLGILSGVGAALLIHQYENLEIIMIQEL
jgi:hypothetical protein